MVSDSDGLEAEDEFSAEDWIYVFSTQDFLEGEFTEVRLPLNDPDERQDAFVSDFPGDEEINFGMWQMHVQSLFGSEERLHLEIESIRIAEAQPGAVGDFNNNGSLDAEDIEILSAAVRDMSQDAQFDLNADGTVDEADRETWIIDLKNNTFLLLSATRIWTESSTAATWCLPSPSGGTKPSWTRPGKRGIGTAMPDSTRSDFVAAFPWRWLRARSSRSRGPRATQCPRNPDRGPAADVDRSKISRRALARGCVSWPVCRNPFAVTRVSPILGSFPTAWRSPFRLPSDSEPSTVLLSQPRANALRLIVSG